MGPHSTNIYFESDRVTVYFELNRIIIIENLLTYNNRIHDCNVLAKTYQNTNCLFLIDL